MYNDKGNTKYLKLLKQNYSSSQDVIREIVNLSAIINLPKGTEFFLSDIHGEYEAFLHIMNNCSGVIKEKVDLIFKDTISDYDRQELCTLIYYPREKMALLDEQGKIDSDWYAMTLNQLILTQLLQAVVHTGLGKLCCKLRTLSAGAKISTNLQAQCSIRFLSDKLSLLCDIPAKCESDFSSSNKSNPHTITCLNLLSVSVYALPVEA